MTEQPMIQRIIELEEQYHEAFCTKANDGAITRYEDLQIRDMHSHNFSLIQEELSSDELLQVIEAEKARRVEADQDFLMLRYNWKVEAADLPEELQAGLAVMEYYRLPKKSVDLLRERDDVEVIGLSDFLLEDAKELDELCEENESKDFTNRRFERRSRVYLSDQGPDQFLALLDWMPVGTCDYFTGNGACMLEDFVVDPVYRRQGIGTTILKRLARRAFSEGNDLIFLTCDSREPAREMYIKLGFEKIWETTELLIKGLK